MGINLLSELYFVRIERRDDPREKSQSLVKTTDSLSAKRSLFSYLASH
ncbi:MAG: hypothetical protein AAF694_12795 [Bacteroidota bacterium]